MAQKRKASSSTSKKSKKMKQEENTPVKEESQDINEETNSQGSGDSNSSTNKSKNKKKIFHRFLTRSCRFIDSSPLDYNLLIETTEKHGQDMEQYCSLGIFIPTDYSPENPSMILNKRFRSAISSSEHAKGVTLIEIINRKGKEKTVVTHACKKDSTSRYFSSYSYLKSVHNNTSNLAWTISYGDGTFDVHVLKNLFHSTVANNSKGEYQEFATYFKDEKFFLAEATPKVARPNFQIENPILNHPTLEKQSLPIAYSAELLIQTAVDVLKQLNSNDLVPIVLDLVRSSDDALCAWDIEKALFDDRMNLLLRLPLIMNNTQHQSNLGAQTQHEDSNPHNVDDDFLSFDHPSSPTF